MAAYENFELRRLSDGLIYEFERMTRTDGSIGYKRRDQDIWIVFKPQIGWVVYDEDHNAITGKPWNVQPYVQDDHPPEGEWVSKKGIQSYVYELRYVL